VGLAVRDEELAACVSCGLCLPHCPTFRVTGEEAESPRGRIAAMRLVHEGRAPASGEFASMVGHCVMCRGCEPACPSGVRFGRLIDAARQAAVAALPPWRRLALRAAYWPLSSRPALLAGATLLAGAQRARLVPRRLGLPRLPLRRPALAEGGPTTGQPAAWLFVGCVMDAWMRPTHQAALRVMAATGEAVGVWRGGYSCCGALHVHAGLRAQGRRLASQVVRSAPQQGAVVVDSAGCGALMKSYGELLGSEEAARFASRVVDACEWLAPRLSQLPARRSFPGPVAVQDPCHLRHVQGVHHQVRQVLGVFCQVVELDDEGLCCGAGGSYWLSQPAQAARIRQAKLDAIGRSGARVVASANPGCALYLRAAGVDARHPLELADAALDLGGAA
jgi:glycolate oxidase iron-sulfur subunit